MPTPSRGLNKAGILGNGARLVWPLLLVAVLVLAACAPAAAPAASTDAADAGAAAPEASGGGVLRIGLDVDAGTGDPRLSSDTSALRLRELIYNGLVKIEPDFSPAPALAESWENPDDTTWIFNLRPDVTFHNGDPFTAEDVKFTFDTILNPDFASPVRSFYTPITNIEVVDPLTVKFTLDQPYGPFLSYMNMPIVPKGVVEADAEAFATSPVGTGPFKLVEWKRGDSMMLEANPDYWDGAPLLSGIEMRVVPDNSARVVALESGDLDLVQSPISPQDVKRLEGEEGIVVNRVPAAGYTYVNLNCADPAISDVRVRQALSHLVNRQEILDSIYAGIGQLANGPVPPGMWAFSPDLPSYDYDPEAARALLDEAGWTLGDDGMRSKDGQPLSIVVRTHSEDPDRRQVTEVLQAVLTAEGIDASTNIVDWPTFFSDVQAGAYQMAIVGWLNLNNPDAAFFRQFTEGGAANYGTCIDPELDALIRQARATLDQEEAKELYRQAATLVVENAFYIFLQYQEYISAHSDNVQGFVVNPVQNFNSMNKVSLSD
jgi:peptide/nickel transport system substrate-binding protein